MIAAAGVAVVAVVVIREQVSSGRFDAYTAMYQATGETRYLDTALELIANMVEDARPSSSIETSQYRDRYPLP